MATPDEVLALQRQWMADPSWDIEETAGFEAHVVELSAFRKKVEARRQFEREQEFDAFSRRAGCLDNPTLARTLQGLCRRLDALESLVASMREDAH